MMFRAIECGNVFQAPQGPVAASRVSVTTKTRTKTT